jgi:hypothetical protein
MRFNDSQRTVRVNKTTLIEQITANRDEHQGIFEAAQEKYRERVIAALDKNLDAARKGKKIVTYIALPEPVNYTDEYNNVLAQLEWETRDEVDLEAQDFNRLVLNKWEWAENFAANTSSYLVGSAR